MPNCAWPGLVDGVTSAPAPSRSVEDASRQRRAQRTERCIDVGRLVARGGIGEALVEHHGDVRAEPRLDVDGALGRQQMPGAVEVRLELGAFLGDHAPLGEAEDLEAAAVGQDRPVPADEAVQAAAPRDQLVAGAEKEVIGVAEDDLGAGARRGRGAAWP